MAGDLLFDEEFNKFDPYSKDDAWKTSFHWGSDQVLGGEKGYYVDTENGGGNGTNPFSVSNGVLSITSTPASGLPNDQSYTTGVITSQGSFAHQYGYYEMRAELPGGKGFFPAFWMLPADKQTLPELDIMEYSSRFPNEYVTTLHSKTGNGSPVVQEFAKGLPDLSDGFHTFGVDWQENEISWYFDGKEVYSAPTPSDLHTPMYMMLNQAVDRNSWIGPPDGSTQDFKIDYVRVYDSKPASAGAAAAPAQGTAPMLAPSSDTLLGGAPPYGDDQFLLAGSGGAAFSGGL
ncbi:glycoside hydrolase family 16 protein [Azospirillum sp. sgz301742]